MRTIVDAESLPERAEGITGAAWSPDRKWVAFRAGGPLGRRHPRRRSATAHLGLGGWSPWAWSPTEDQLVVVLGRDVTLIDAATGRETDLGTTVGAKDIEGYAVHTLVWSPDGTRIDVRRGARIGLGLLDRRGERRAYLARRPARGCGGDQRHRLVAGWRALGDLVRRRPCEQIKAKALYLANADGSDLRLVDHIVASQWGVWIPG